MITRVPAGGRSAAGEGKGVFSPRGDVDDDREKTRCERKASAGVAGASPARRSTCDQPCARFAPQRERYTVSMRWI